MVINNPSMSTTSVTDSDLVPLVLEMLSEVPSTEIEIVPPRPPGQVCGAYNGSTDTVEIYVVDGSGKWFLRCE